MFQSSIGCYLHIPTVVGVIGFISIALLRRCCGINKVKEDIVFISIVLRRTKIATDAGFSKVQKMQCSRCGRMLSTLPVLVMLMITMMVMRMMMMMMVVVVMMMMLII